MSTTDSVIENEVTTIAAENDQKSPGDVLDRTTKELSGAMSNARKSKVGLPKGTGLSDGARDIERSLGLDSEDPELFPSLFR